MLFTEKKKLVESCYGKDCWVSGCVEFLICASGMESAPLVFNSASVCRWDHWEVSLPIRALH